MEPEESAPPAILDDVAPAVMRLTELGRWVLHLTAQATQQSVVMFAAIKRWPVVSHGSFIQWAERRLSSDIVWLLLDPLCAATSGGPANKQVRVTRVLTRAGWTLDAQLSEPILTFVRGRRVGLLDDVVASGRTLKAVAEEVSKAGGEVTNVIVGMATAKARQAVRELLPEVSWSQFLEGNYSGMHLRDGCPCLPYSGRRVDEFPPIITPSGPIGIRLPPMVMKGGSWDQIGSDRYVQQAFWHGRQQLVGRFTEALGRQATVADVPMLGSEVEIPLYATNKASADTLLETILLGTTTE